MRKIKFRPSRVSVIRSHNPYTYGVVFAEVTFTNPTNGMTSVVQICQEKWYKLFKEVFKNATDLRAYDSHAEYSCYDIDEKSPFRLCGIVDGLKKFEMTQLIDNEKKIWK